MVEVLDVEVSVEDLVDQSRRPMVHHQYLLVVTELQVDLAVLVAVDTVEDLV